MAIPKEPRALMINLMYLVLTAMLALNVSAEIINAFFMLDKGIKHTNEIVDKGLEGTIKAMNSTAKEKPALKPIAAAAETVPAQIEELLVYIDTLRVNITNGSGGLYSTEDHKATWEGKGFQIGKIVTGEEEKLDGKPKGKKNKDITQRLLVDEGNGAKLKELIGSTRTKLIKVIDDIVALNKKTPMKGVKFKESEIEELKKNLVLEEIDDKVWEDAGKPSWEAYVFGYMPVAACYPLFRKYQNDAKNAAAQVINFLSNNMGNKVLVYDKFDVFSSSTKPYILLGETYEAEIALGAYSSQAKFSVNVGGRALPITDAKAKFTAKPSSVGTQKYTATITVENPLTGETERVSKEFAYEVGVPSVTVAADKMNVFYIGVDNPISIAAAGVSSNDIAVSVSGSGGAKLKPAGKGKYIVNATKMTKKGAYCNIVVTNKKTGKALGSYPFRVKRIPDPIAILTNGKSDGTVKAGEMRVQRGLIAKLQNFDFDAQCKIQSFTMYYTPPRQDPVPAKNNGGTFSGTVLNSIRSAKPGGSFQFVDVKGRCPGDAVGRKLNGLAFQIR